MHTVCSQRRAETRTGLPPESPEGKNQILDAMRRRTPFFGRPVVAPAEVSSLRPKRVILASIHAGAMREQLLQLGVPAPAIVDLRVPLLPTEWFSSLRRAPPSGP